MNILVVYKDTAKELADHIKSILDGHEIKSDLIKRQKFYENLCGGRDLIIVVGGDGTFLRVAHFVGCNIPLLGVNSDPGKTIGFFSRADKSDFDEKFELFMKKKHKTILLHRLSAKIRDKILYPILNEVFIGKPKPYHTAEYELIVDGKREVQKSSGVLVATASGSNAWLKSAGGKPLPLSSDKVQYIVREPYIMGHFKNELRHGFVKDSVEIISHIDDGVVVIDSLSEEYSLKKGEKVVVTKDAEQLSLVSF